VATANAGSSQSVCSGTSLTLAGAVGGAASGGTWSGGAGTYVPDNATLNAVYTPSAAEYAAGSVTLTLTTNDPSGPCTFASSSVTFFFYENPVIAFTVDDPNGCPVHCGAFTDQTTIGGGDNIVSGIGILVTAALSIQPRKIHRIVLHNRFLRCNINCDIQPWLCKHPYQYPHGACICHTASRF